MYHEFFTSKGVLVMPIVAMLLFCVTFTAAVAWTLLRKRQEAYKYLSNLPLADDAKNSLESGGGRGDA